MYIDVSLFTRAPRISASSGFALTHRLLRVAPKQPSPRVHKALERLLERGEKLQEVLRERARLQSFSLRPYDQDFDGTWGAFVMRLQAHARNPRSKHRARASELLAELLPKGMSFLGLAYEDELLHSHTLLQRIDGEGLAEELDALAGGSFLADVRAAHEALGEALGVGKSEPEASPSLSEALTELAHAIASYGRVLAGEIDEDDPASLAAFEAAMAPRVDHAARYHRSASASEVGAQDELDELDELDEQGELDEALDEELLLDTELPELPPLLDPSA